jgi:phosphoadenosine phosphosulfate reductase
MAQRSDAAELNKLLSGKSTAESLKTVVSLFPEKVLFTTSFGIEDQVITHFISENHLPIEIATLDTGRLFPETYMVFHETLRRYKKKISVYFPDRKAVETMLNEKGPYSFYSSKEDRLECCNIRKIEPLKRALKGNVVWISGIRADQSDFRSYMEWIEYDEEKHLIRFYPLFNWSYEDVRNFVNLNNVPYNGLHDNNYLSIGCEPCTRALLPGENFRSGRWWWETDEIRECGCHLKLQNNQ